jgi:hypothetical protein
MTTPEDDRRATYQGFNRIMAVIVVVSGTLMILSNLRRLGVITWPESYGWIGAFGIAAAIFGITMGVRTLSRTHASAPQLPMTERTWRVFVTVLGGGAVLFGTMAAMTPSPGFIAIVVLWIALFLFFLIFRRPRQA